MAKDLAIVLNNGSINSALATALANQRYRLVMLHMTGASAEDDSQETSTRARIAFDQQTAYFKPYREHVLPMPFLSPLNSAGGPRRSIETSGEPKPQQRLGAPLLEMLPIMAVAARFASHYQAVSIHLGLRVGNEPTDLAQVTEYVQLWQELLQLPCGAAELEVHAPLLELEPWQVVDLGYQVNVPFERTWSCSGDGGEPCWACRGCRNREAAFQRAAKPDPLRLVRK